MRSLFIVWFWAIHFHIKPRSTAEVAISCYSFTIVPYRINPKHMIKKIVFLQPPSCGYVIVGSYLWYVACHKAVHSLPTVLVYQQHHEYIMVTFMHGHDSCHRSLILSTSIMPWMYAAGKLIFMGSHFMPSHNVNQARFTARMMK